MMLKLQLIKDIFGYRVTQGGKRGSFRDAINRWYQSHSASNAGKTKAITRPERTGWPSREAA